ncbi:MAG TPA: GerMN domain-containing protein [Firmicutes bacterium]|nr:GerMN domain-containing protein [Bacillota bacterium]
MRYGFSGEIRRDHEIRRSSVGSGREAAMVQSIVRTLCQFQAVGSVRIMIEGKSAMVWWVMSTSAVL